MTEKFKVLEFPHFEDARGTLTPFEFDQLPFVPQRVYFVTSKNGAVRGGHAHTIVEEIFVVAHGSVSFLVNDGTGDQKILLDTPNRAVWVRTGCWHELHEFSDDAVVVAFSSTKYLPGDGNYQTDKKEFLKIFRQK